MSLESLFSIFSNIIHFAIVLGLAVIFHEWGHFIVAKLCGAKVDRFAVGFGKVLFSYTWHETEYCLCAFPLGGYVKIRGMDPEEELTGSEWEFLQLAPWKRIFIVVAGPAMNIVLALLVYIFIFGYFGQPYRATQTVGHVPYGTWGWEIGLQDGDKIVQINDQKVSSWDEISSLQANINQEELHLTIQREGETITKTKEIPSYLQEPSPINVPTETREGLFILNILPGSPAEEAGIKPGDSITQIDGQHFQDTNQWSEYISNRFQKNEEDEYEPIPMNITVQKLDGSTKTFEITPELVFPAEDATPYKPQARLGISFDSEVTLKEYLMPTVQPLGVAPKISPIIGYVQEGSPADKAGLPVDSRIVQINNEPVDDWVDVILKVHESLDQETGEAEPLSLTWLTPNNEMKQATITPNIVEQPIYTKTSVKTGKTYKMAQIGVDYKVDRKKMGVVGSVIAGWNKLIEILMFMLNFLGQLFTGGVSPKLLGGPIAIFQMSGETGRWGMERFLSFIALLSANLALINLFPLPPFDGGHVIFYLIEMVRMKPLTMRQMEMFGKVGAIIVIPLLLFLIINDLSRVNFFSWISGLFSG